MKTLVTEYWFVVALLLAEWGPCSFPITTIIIISSEWAVRCHVLSRGRVTSGVCFSCAFEDFLFFSLPFPSLQPSPRVLDSALCIPPSPSVSRGFWLRHAGGVNPECNVLEQRTSPRRTETSGFVHLTCVNKVLERDEGWWVVAVVRNAKISI